MYISTTYVPSKCKTFITLQFPVTFFFSDHVFRLQKRGMLRQVLFLGAPGVGKGTYARRAAPVLGFGHISPGDLLRASVQDRPDIQEYLKRGELVPEELVFSLVDEKMKSLKTGGYKGVILDGFPRSRAQAQGWLDRHNTSNPDLVVEFQLPEDLLFQKLLGRRTCSACGDLYNMFAFTEGEYSMPAMLPKKEGVCDKCGGALVKRIDDTIDVIRDRLANHWKTEKELVEFLKDKVGCFETFPVKTGIAQVHDLVRLIKRRLDIA